MTSRVVIGTPRFAAKPPRRHPCTDPLVYAANLLRDPGFGNQLSAWGSGPNLADDIPHWVNSPTSVLFRWPETADALFHNDPPLGDDTYWMQDWTNVLTGRWGISTVNPRTSTRHARIATDAANRVLVPVRKAFCQPNKNGGTRQAFYSAIVSPGDAITFSLYAMAGAAGATMTIALSYLSPLGDFTDYLDTTPSIGTAYGQLSLSDTVPAGAGAVQVYIWVNESGFTVDVDDCVLALT